MAFDREGFEGWMSYLPWEPWGASAWQDWRNGALIGKTLRLPYKEEGLVIEVLICWGVPTAHPQQWASWVRYVVDLEVHRTDFKPHPFRGANLIAHIERPFRDVKLASAWRDWLRSCIETTGMEGIIALNARSEGNLA